MLSLLHLSLVLSATIAAARAAPTPLVRSEESLSATTGSVHVSWTKEEIFTLVGVIVGCFVFPPFGIIIVPFVAVLVVEMIQEPNLTKALKASFGSVVAFLASSVAQAIIMIIMVIWFFVDTLLIN